MNAQETLAHLIRLGVRLEAHGDRLRFAPRSAVSAEMLDRIQAHKPSLMAMLHSGGGVELMTPATEPEPLDTDGWPVGSINPSDVTPCPICQSLNQWESVAGTWRCRECSPPNQSRQLAEKAGWIRRRDTSLQKDN